MFDNMDKMLPKYIYLAVNFPNLARIISYRLICYRLIYMLDYEHKDDPSVED